MRCGAPARTLSITRAVSSATSQGRWCMREPAGVEPGHVEQLGDQAAEPVGVGVDRGEHQLLLLVVEPVPPVEQRLDEALHAGQRRAQLVGDRGDQVGAVAVEAGAGPAGAQAAPRRR